MWSERESARAQRVVECTIERRREKRIERERKREKERERERKREKEREGERRREKEREGERRREKEREGVKEGGGDQAMQHEECERGADAPVLPRQLHAVAPLGVLHVCRLSLQLGMSVLQHTHLSTHTAAAGNADMCMTAAAGKHCICLQHVSGLRVSAALHNVYVLCAVRDIIILHIAQCVSAVCSS